MSPDLLDQLRIKRIKQLNKSIRELGLEVEKWRNLCDEAIRQRDQALAVPLPQEGQK